MTDQKKPLQSIFSNTCGRCGQGKIFDHFFWMNATCPSCGYRFENEEGHFIGAMIIAYFVTSFLAVPTLLLSLFKYDVEYQWIGAMVVGQMILTGPVIYRYSKLLWIHMEERFVSHLHRNEK